jgi:hypothetical protein
MKLRRRTTITSSLDEISTDQLGKKLCGGEGVRRFSVDVNVFSSTMDIFFLASENLR